VGSHWQAALATTQCWGYLGAGRHLRVGQRAWRWWPSVQPEVGTMMGATALLLLGRRGWSFEQRLGARMGVRAALSFEGDQCQWLPWTSSRLKARIVGLPCHSLRATSCVNQRYGKSQCPRTKMSTATLHRVNSHRVTGLTGTDSAMKNTLLASLIQTQSHRPQVTQDTTVNSECRQQLN
jgi:hypothetical protein